MTASLERGATLGRYVVLDKLGGGGMGVVYAAFDPELDRRIAIKLLKPGSGAGAPEGRARLLREAQALARLSHPNVIAVHDVGTFEDQVFVAMEYVEGATLGVWAAAERRPWTATCDAYVQAGRGLAAAHAVGIVHRDFKPDNVLVGKDGRVRVLDFGLARAAGDGATAPADDSVPLESRETAAASSSPALGTPLTRAGSFMGTPAYSSPEQLRGDPADARSDQFSFCVALFEALYGERPFSGKNITEIATAIVKGELPSPPAGNRVPPRVRTILARGLSAEPGGRYPTMDALLAALAHDPSVARRRVAVAAGVVALAGVGAYSYFGRAAAEPCTGAQSKLAGIWDAANRDAISRAFIATGKGFAPGAFDGAARVLDAYAHEWVAMSTESCRATRVRGEQSEQLLDLRTFCLTKHLAALQAATALLAHPDDKVVLNAGDIAKHLPAIDECADTARLRAVVAPPADPAVRAKITDVERQLATSRALADAQRMKDAAAALPAPAAVAAIGYKPLEARLLFARGWVEYQTPDLPTATTTYRDAIVAAETVGDDLLAAQSWLELSGTLMDQRKLADARDVIRHVPALLERIGGNPRLEARFDYYAGWIELYDSASKPADVYLRKALEIRQRVLPPDDPDLLESLEAEARRFGSRRKFDESLALNRKILAAREKLYGGDHPSVAESLQNIASTLRKMGDDEAAIPLLTRALDIFERTGSKSFWKRYVLGGLAAANERIGKHDLAVSYAKQTIEFEQAIAPGLNNPGNLATAYGWYAQILRMRGDYAAALEQVEHALAIADKNLKPDDNNYVPWLTELGLVKLGLDRASEAIAPLERAMALVDSRPDDWNGDQGAQARFALARALRAVGRDPDRARTLAQKARDMWAEWGKAKVAEVAEADAFLAKP